MTASPAISKKTTADKTATLDYKPLVVEGRTWWYANDIFGYKALNMEVLSGVRIGEETEIDGVRWNKAEIILSKGYSENSIEPATLKFEYISEPRLIAYVREEAGNVYVKRVDTDATNKIYGEMSNPWWYHHSISYPFTDAVVYKFGKTEDVFTGGSEQINADFRIESVEPVENSGRNYKKYIAKPESGDLFTAPASFEFYEQIGSTTGLFFYPYGHWMVGSDFVYGDIHLCYVTEGEDNSIIFTGEGGVKLWEEYAGIGSVETDGEESPARWFNLQGTEVDSPTLPGIYIKATSGKREKVIIR